MALSSSESALLTQTCENMNIAANTCREVLEMLRNLGNTGVVDIATHNNTPGAHANDDTLIHLTNYLTGKEYHIGDKDGMDYWPLWQRCTSKEVSTFTRWNTYGRYNSTLSYNFAQSYCNLTDSSGTRISFENNTSITGYQSIYYERHDFQDADNNRCIVGFIHRAGARTADGLKNGTTGWTCIGPVLSKNLSGTFTVPYEFNAYGIVPLDNNTISLGVSGYAIKDIFLVNQPTVTSDRRAKKDVSALGSQAVDFIKALRPVSYRLKQGEGQLEQFNEQGEVVPNDTPDREGIRTHWGLIAQEVKEALTTAGIEDAALWCLADKDDPDSQQSLRYEELIAPMIKVIQNQQERIEALERRVA